MAKLSVMIADDDAGIRTAVEKMLEADYRVVAKVENGRQLLEGALLLNPDLLVIDGAMPVMNGLEALRRLRALRCASKVVVLSEHHNPAFVRRALQTGAGAFVSKAHAGEDLLKALAAVIRGETFVSGCIEDPHGIALTDWAADTEDE